jgi:acyl carrier protein
MLNEQIAHQVIDVIADVLEMEVDEISTESKIIDELGADSLDIVDLSFSLGKSLGIKMPQKSVIMHAEEVMGDLSELIVGGKLTVFGAILLQQGPNRYDVNEVYPGQSLGCVFATTKVQHWINFREWTLR